MVFQDLWLRTDYGFNKLLNYGPSKVTSLNKWRPISEVGRKTRVYTLTISLVELNPGRA
jgi:hypothetical protein